MTIAQSVKHRLQLDFTEEALKELDNLKDFSGLPNRAEVIRQALRLLQWTIEETQDNGAKILLEKDGKQREVFFPFLAKKVKPQPELVGRY
jgi:metal-responsive CopG/Arc/MetJ family transcriptional regulator